MTSPDPGEYILRDRLSVRVISSRGRVMEKLRDEDLRDEDLLEAAGGFDDMTDEDLLQAVESMEQREEEDGQTGGESRKRKRTKEGTFQFTAIPFRERTAKKYGIKRTSYHLRLANQDLPVGHRNIVRAFEQGLARTIGSMIEGLPAYDRIQVYLGSNRLRSSHTSAHVSVEQWRDPLGASRQILDNISRLLNSNENFEPDDSLQLDVTHISMPKPGLGKPKGKRKKWCFGTDNYSELLKNKRSVFRIKNKDDLCCARALVVGKAVADDDPQTKLVKDGRRSMQETRARQLQEEARVPPGPCGLAQIKLFEIILSDYQLVVVSAEHGHAIVHKGPPCEKQIFLLMHDGHFDVITSMPGFFDKNYFCLECEKGYSTEDYIHHPCNSTKCNACYQMKCHDYDLLKHIEKPELFCPGCNRHFYGQTCRDNHLNRKANGHIVGPDERNVCHTHKKCSVCLQLYTSSSLEHSKHCGLQYCYNCKKEVNMLQHRCYLQCIDKENEDTNKTVFVYFDIEARQDTGNHVANLLCAETSLDDIQHTFKGETCVTEFLGWVHSMANDELVDQTVVVAHNFKSYDGYFVLEELYRQHVSNLEQIVNGAKILSLRLPHVKFIDSLNFFPMPLSAFPKTFGLEELKKGFFPHFFNTVTNQVYVGVVPDVEYYDPDGMSPARRQEFLAWHTEKRSSRHVFDFEKELLEYCQSDVRLLKQGCEKFQKEFQDICGFNPIRYCITIASACNVAYRRNWMPPKKIAVKPVRGWRPNHVQSHAALEWLAWKEHELSSDAASSASFQVTPYFPRIAHARNQGERRIADGRKTYLVDGFDKETRTVYEFQGCFFHGCRACLPRRDAKHPYHTNKTMRTVREETRQKIERLTQLGYTVCEMWECEWQRQKQTDERVRDFVSSLDIVTPLDPRDAFFGGRTNAVKLHHQVQGDEEIHYTDMISLYPCANLECPYPEGHPKFTDQPQTTNIEPYHGLVKCEILPPFDLYHPVLPYRVESKLLFPLCRTCAHQQLAKHFSRRTFECGHDVKERAITGTWTTLELKKALDKKDTGSCTCTRSGILNSGRTTCLISTFEHSCN